MARYNNIKNSFLGGELSPKAHGRTDLPQYQHGCESIENFIPQLQGGATRRAGSQYIKGTQDNQEARLIPFVFSEDESYVVEFGGTINSGTIRVINTSDNTVSTPSTSYANQGYYTLSQIFDIQYCQSADYLYLVHPDVPPQMLVRTALNTFEIRVFWREDDRVLDTSRFHRLWPYRTVNVDSSKTLACSSTSTGTGRTLTASGFTFDPSHVGSVWKLTHNSSGLKTGVVEITAVASGGATATCNVINTLFSTSATDNWEESAWSFYRGWPRSIAFFEDRLCYGGNTFQPDMVWMSYTSDYTHMQATDFDTSTGAASDLTDSTAFNRSCASQQINKIQWMSSKDILVVGTAGAEYVFKQADPTQAFSNNNFSVREQTSHGSARVQAVNASGATLFVTRDARKIREFLFYFESDSYAAENLSIIADHMAGRREDGSPYDGPASIIEIAWQESESVLWCLDSSFGLFAVTRDRKTGIAAWHRHLVGGTAPNSESQAHIHSICVVPGINGLNDDLWLIAKRTINGSDESFVEKIARYYEIGNLSAYTSGVTAPIYSDSAKWVDMESLVTTVTGYSHLIGETVQVVADGLYVGTQVVDGSGNLTLLTPAQYIVAGLPYRSLIITLTPEAGSQIGSSQGSINRIDRSIIRLYKTAEGRIGSSLTTYETLNFRIASLASSDLTPLFTGDKLVHHPASPEREAKTYIMQVLPFPMTVVCVISRGVVNDV